MAEDSSIYVTGLGVVSPIGIGTEDFWAALQARKSGVSLDPRLLNTNIPWRMSARIDEFDGKRYIKPRKAIKVMCREIQFGYVAATMAVEQSIDAPLPSHPFDPDRLAVVFGSETFHGEPEELTPAFQKCCPTGEFDKSLWGTVAMTEIQPLWMLKYLPNMAASHISIAVDARGPNNTICQGDVSGMLAMIEGADLIRRGWTDATIVGGTSSRTSLVSMVYRGNAGLSSRFDAPESAMRPFDRDRDGIVHSEGAAAMVLESSESVLRRRANPLAKLAGWSRGFGDFQSPLFWQTIRDVAQNAISMAGIAPGSFGHINAHGASATREDWMEGQAIRNLNLSCPVVAIKGNLGQSGPSSSVMETVASVLAVQQGTLPPACAFENVDPDIGLELNPESIRLPNKNFLKLSFSTEGHVAAMVFTDV
jgi:3-oxoacyl-[acyl-carrier-protein] synthase II